METDIDNNKSDNRANEFEHQLMMETRAANSSKPDIYLNTYDPSALNHDYKNVYERDLNEIHGHKIEGAEQLNHAHMEVNPYEDDVQTVHSEGIRSEMESAMPPPLHQRPHHNKEQPDEDEITKDIENEICTLTLGDISEADDRVKKFYGIIPKDNNKEIKTVRMVKRDSKERSTSALGNGTSTGNNIANKFYDEINENDVQNAINENEYLSDGLFKNAPPPPPPPPLPRGNYGQNLHNFLSTQPPSKQELQNGFDENMDNIIDLTSTSKSGTADKNVVPSNERKYRGQIINGEDISKTSVNGSQTATTTASNTPKTNFVLGEYQRRKSKVCVYIDVFFFECYIILFL